MSNSYSVEFLLHISIDFFSQVTVSIRFIGHVPSGRGYRLSVVYNVWFLYLRLFLNLVQFSIQYNFRIQYDFQYNSIQFRTVYFLSQYSSQYDFSVPLARTVNYWIRACRRTDLSFWGRTDTFFFFLGWQADARLHCRWRYFQRKTRPPDFEERIFLGIFFSPKIGSTSVFLFFTLGDLWPTSSDLFLREVSTW